MPNIIRGWTELGSCQAQAVVFVRKSGFRYSQRKKMGFYKDCSGERSKVV